MVQLADVAAINSNTDVALATTGETAEAQEARISDLYDSALHAVDPSHSAVGALPTLSYLQVCGIYITDI